jgi:hypothetical protein
MFPNFHKSGTIPDCKDALHILVSGFAKIAAVSFNAFGCIPSGKTSYSVTSNLGLYQGDPLLYSY